MATRTRISKDFDEAVEWLTESMQKHVIKVEEHLAVLRVLQGLEQEYKLHLSPGARLMLLIPLLEIAEAEDVTGGEIALPSPATVEDSLSSVVNGMQEAGAEFDARFAKAVEEPGVTAASRRSSLSIIKEFWRQFCRIPPFCGERQTKPQ